MRKTEKQNNGSEEKDTMRPEYDFSGAKRGVTAARFAEGANVIVVASDIADVFPDSESVNEALRALAPVIRNRRKADSPAGPA